MGLSKNDSDVLWEAVKTRKFVAFLCSLPTSSLYLLVAIENVELTEMCKTKQTTFKDSTP